MANFLAIEALSKELMAKILSLGIFPCLTEELKRFISSLQGPHQDAQKIAMALPLLGGKKTALELPSERMAVLDLASRL